MRNDFFKEIKMPIATALNAPFLAKTKNAPQVKKSPKPQSAAVDLEEWAKAHPEEDAKIRAAVLKEMGLA